MKAAISSYHRLSTARSTRTIAATSTIATRPSTSWREGRSGAAGNGTTEPPVADDRAVRRSSTTRPTIARIAKGTIARVHSALRAAITAPPSSSAGWVNQRARASGPTFMTGHPAATPR
jgi:hypothetical protein